MAPDEERLKAFALAVDRDVQRNDRPPCPEVYDSDRAVMVMSSGQAVRAPENPRAGEKAHTTMPRGQRMVPQRTNPKGDTVVVEMIMRSNDGRSAFGSGSGPCEGLIVSDESYSTWPGGGPGVTEAGSTSKKVSTGG